MAASSEKTAPSNNRQGGGKNEIVEVFSIPISTKKRKRGEESKNERHTSSKGKEKQEKPTPASAAKKVRFQEEVTTETKEIDERQNSILKRRKESSLVENDKKKDEGKEKHSSVEVLDHIHTKNMIEGCVKSMISEAKQEFGKENKSIMDAFQNKARQGNEKRKGSASYKHRADMFDSLPCSHYIRSDMLEAPLNDFEIEELNEKWRQVQETELKARIGRVALMNEELQMRMPRIRKESNDKRC
ncbi:protein MNN4-like [Cryptomeria japonica]|uniref:protein MNN4-like n=1 Tax=Cryptomeria japonica TaxID=3369 RepID=UPI0027DA1F4F|nr:protein MNN4-like [Cryptomeria japonica]